MVNIVSTSWTALSCGCYILSETDSISMLPICDYAWTEQQFMQLVSTFVYAYSKDVSAPLETICYLESKKISNDQKLIQSNSTPCPQNQTGKYINWQQFTKGTRGKPNEQLFPKQVGIHTPTNHSHARPRSIQNVHKRSFWFSIRGVKMHTFSRI